MSKTKNAGKPAEFESAAEKLAAAKAEQSGNAEIATAEESEAPVAQEQPTGVGRIKRLPKEVNAAVTFVAENRLALLDVAEQILFAYANEVETHGAGSNAWKIRQSFDADELAVFDSLGWDEERLTRETGRAKSILALQCAAGTTAERQAAADRLATAKEALETRGPALKEQIDQLKRELENLEKSTVAIGRDVATRQNAAERLLEKAPQHVDEQIRRERLAIHRQYQNEIDDAKEELAALTKEESQPQHALRVNELRQRLDKLSADRAAEIAAVKKRLLEKYTR